MAVTRAAWMRRYYVNRVMPAFPKSDPRHYRCFTKRGAEKRARILNELERKAGTGAQWDVRHVKKGALASRSPGLPCPPDSKTAELSRCTEDGHGVNPGRSDQVVGGRQNGLVVNEHLEGWCTDPFVRHEARWMSDGTPTELVRDGSSESYDDPPDVPWTRDPEPISPVGSSDSLRRADDAQDEHFDPQRAIDAAGTAFIETWQSGGGVGGGTATPPMGLGKPAKGRSRLDENR
jgi:hypothetical protein